MLKFIIFGWTWPQPFGALFCLFSPAQSSEVLCDHRGWRRISVERRKCLGSTVVHGGPWWFLKSGTIKSSQKMDKNGSF